MLVLLAALGLVMGIVINSLADNLPPDERGVRRGPRRPRCRHCGQAHRSGYWAAIVSYLVLGGRCEHCGRRRPARLLLVELASMAALPYVLVWAVGNGATAWQATWKFMAGAIILAIFLLITVIDIEHRLILRIVVLPALLIVAVIGSLDPTRGLVKTLAGGVVGYGLMFGVYLLAGLYTAVQDRLRGKPMEEVAFGGGDVNLAAVVGCVVGWPGVLLALLIAIFSGAAYSLFIIIPQLVRRRYSPHSVIPYGPFLVLGALLIYFYGREFAAFWATGHQ